MISLTELIESAKDAERAGALDEALSGYERALWRCGREGDAAMAATLLRWIGNVRRARGDIALALELYEASLVIAAVNELTSEEVAALNCLAIAAQLSGEVDQALWMYHQARGLATHVQDHRLVAMIEQNMGALANMQGRLKEALGHYRTALAVARRVGDDTTISHALNNIGMAHLDLGEWEEAERSFDQASSLAEAMGDLALVGTVALNRAELHLHCRRPEAGKEACDRALEAFNVLRSKPSIGEAYKLYGMLYHQMDDVALAHAHFASALGLAETSNDLLLQAETQIEWAALHLQRGRWKPGICYLNGGLLAFSKLKASREILDIQRRLERAESIYIAAVREWARSLEEPAGVEHGHTARVVELACALAESSGIGEWELTTIRVGALVHEVGKAAVDRSISAALKRDRPFLERIETIAGDALVRQLDFPPEVRNIVRSQRERWDGAGYPDGLTGSEIPLGARIVSISDTFDRLASGVPEKAPLTAGDALTILRTESGGAFDPVLVERFEVLVTAGALDLD